MISRKADITIKTARLIIFDGKKLPFSDGRFDSVVSFEVLEHVFNLPQILQEINRVTKDSGLFLISVPFAWGEHEAPYDFARYTSYGMTDILNKNGFEVIEYKKTTTHFSNYMPITGILFSAEYCSKKNIYYYIFQITIIFPITIIAYAINTVLPKIMIYFVAV